MSLFRIFRRFYRSSDRGRNEIYPDEIFLDARNLPDFDTHQFEGRIERPISKTVFKLTALVFILVGIIFGTKLWMLQVKMGEAYEIRSQNNNLRHTTIFAERGIIYDRNQTPLAWNELNPGGDFSLRGYIPDGGFSHVLGYVKYPSKDRSGIYYEEQFIGKDGVESYYNDLLSGINGLKITETDALGNVQSESVLTLPKDGENITLSIDAEVTAKLFEAMKKFSRERGFLGGAGVIMDVHNGEILALVSYPEYNNKVLTDGSDKEAVSRELNAPGTPFLDRVISGQYIPGSIMKPFIAMGVLGEGVIDPMKKIQSVGQISIPNPYNPEMKTIFRDWKIHGWVDLRHALSVSSDEYFYTVGGGYDGQKGIGITNIEKYVRMFGFGELTGIDLFGEKGGVIPSPAWKAENFDGDDWRLGDTYNSSIGQYGFQVTPLQAVRAVASFANGGKLFTPTIIKSNTKYNEGERIPLSSTHFDIVRDGMRLAVTEGTARGLSMPGISVAAKTGTAELGASKELVNSLVMGYFPFENPKYTFTILMERGPYANQIGATAVMRELLEWMYINTPEYVR